jgi:hypothetical protein
MNHITGRRWRRPARQCPWWCAGGHQCTAQHGYPSGEHRSDIKAWRTRYGRLTVTRMQDQQGIGRLDIRAVVYLPADEQESHRQASRLAVDVDLAIRAVTAVEAAPDPRRITA